MLTEKQKEKINEYIDKYERLCEKNRNEAKNKYDEATVNYLAGRADSYHDAAISLRTLSLLLSQPE